VADFLDASIAEVLDAEFETPLLKGALAFDAVLGNALPPRARGTALLAAMRRAIHAETTEGFVHPQGGAGAFTSALLKAAEGAGVRVRLNARVKHLLFDNGRVARRCTRGRSFRASIRRRRCCSWVRSGICRWR
jgi:phytoene dehydrogenase-like protein